MADPKDRDKDVVVFLGTEHQIADVEEAGQRLAVTALHRVNGDRALHRVLPEQYRSLWHQLGEQVGSLTLMQVKLQREVSEEPSLGIDQMQNRSIAQAAAGIPLFYPASKVLATLICCCVPRQPKGQRALQGRQLLQKHGRCATRHDGYPTCAWRPRVWS